MYRPDPGLLAGVLAFCGAPAVLDGDVCGVPKRKLGPSALQRSEFNSVATQLSRSSNSLLVGLTAASALHYGPPAEVRLDCYLIPRRASVLVLVDLGTSQGLQIRSGWPEQSLRPPVLHGPAEV